MLVIRCCISHFTGKLMMHERAGSVDAPLQQERGRLAGGEQVLYSDNVRYLKSEEILADYEAVEALQ